ncbi:homocysteine S-methyltransferase family protein [Yoonia sp. 2307UL14-13]|uniref:homocysteine S-methyltransferase family protein n=1 Tax=Yoonia sp. 2307UL14-13 TaxID=3126506 RepID=UPI0030A7EEC1
MAQITLMDGGLGQELVRRSTDAPTPLWSTQVMVDHPGMVADIHRDFVAAGARLHVTNTYALHRDRLAGTPLEDRFSDLHRIALDETINACAGHGRIAGSIGPLIASYRPDIHPDQATAVPLYAEVAQLLAPHVDLLIGETIASITHAKAVLEGARSTAKPVWLAMTVDDQDGTRLRSGEPLADVIAIADGASALLANCAAPEAMAAAMDVLATSDKPFGAYANGFTQITKDFLKDKPTVASLRSRDIDPKTYTQFALGWADQGATILGGCCEIGPAHIAHLATALGKAGHTIV